MGAPRANSTFQTLSVVPEPGQVYRCLLGNLERSDCKPLVVEREGNYLLFTEKLNYNFNAFRNQLASESNRGKPYRDRKDYGWLGGSMAVNNPLTGRVAVYKILSISYHVIFILFTFLGIDMRLSLVK